MNSSTYIKNFVKAGWFALHNSVLTSGAEIDTGSYNLYDNTAWVDSEAYLEVLGPILQLTSVIIDMPNDDGDLVAKRVWQKIRKLKVSSSKYHDAFNRTTANELRINYNDWQNKLSHHTRTSIDYKDPLKAAKVGWELIVKASQTNANEHLFFWGLALIGWVNSILYTTKTCPLCFRWSNHGSNFCFQHTQSKNSEHQIAEAYSNYRKGKVLLDLAQERNIIIKPKLILPGMPHAKLLLADFLFFNVYSEEEATELSKALVFFPNVLNFLGGKKVFDLDKFKLHEHVRIKLNPLEFHHSSLLHNIAMAENEFKIQVRNVGRPKGKKSTKTDLAIEKVIHLAASGLCKSDIAKQLNISKSTLSNWITRYTEVKSAFMTYTLELAEMNKL